MPALSGNYATTDLDLAACLVAEDQPLVSAKKTGTRGNFVFTHTPEVERIRLAYLNDSLTVNARKVLNARRSLLDAIKGGL